ncbi:MAG: glycosyltransferase family 2 protein [Bacteroidales bacterium]|nr:glycosyltransferase family 2 protein [Bacteroidales bacterium]
MPKVSVIVPSYNHAKYLKERIDSILNQTFQDFELILLDDCSKDNSAEILLSYKNNKKVSNVIINEKNSGSTFKQWQKGISIAKGSYVWIAESDDYADVSFLEKLVDILEKNHNVGLAYCQSYKVDEVGNVFGDMLCHTQNLDAIRWQKDYFNNGKDEILNYLIYINTIPNASAILFRKSLINTIPNFIINMRLVGDLYFYCYVLMRSDVAFLAQKLNYFRFHYNSVRKTSKHEQTIREHAVGYSYLNKKFHFSKTIKYKIIDQFVGFELYVQFVNSTFVKKINLWFMILFKARMFFVYLNKMMLINMKNKIFNFS